MLSDLLFVLLALSAIIFMFSSPKPEKYNRALLRSWVQIIPPGPLYHSSELRHYFELILGSCRTKSLAENYTEVVTISPNNG
jgi:hypothetical protein